MYTSFLEEICQAYHPDKIKGPSLLPIAIAHDIVEECRWSIWSYDAGLPDE